MKKVTITIKARTFSKLDNLTRERIHDAVLHLLRLAGIVDMEEFFIEEE